MSASVMFVDDDSVVLNAFSRAFRKEPYQLLLAHDYHEAVSMFGKDRIDVVVCDYKMPGPNGLQLLTWIKDRFPSTTRIMLSGMKDSDLVMEAVNIAKVSKFFVKPFNTIELGAAIREGLSLANDPLLAQDTLVNAIDQELEIRELSNYLAEISYVSRDEMGRICIDSCDEELEALARRAERSISSAAKSRRKRN